jgi:hypothetical protein
MGVPLGKPQGPPGFAADRQVAVVVLSAATRHSVVQRRRSRPCFEIYEAFSVGVEAVLREQRCVQRWRSRPCFEINV